MNASLARLLKEIDTHINPVAEDVGFTAKEYAAAKGISESTARTTINRAVKDGVLAMIGTRKISGAQRNTHHTPVYDFVKANKCKSKR